jgi:hypothetical protein
MQPWTSFSDAVRLASESTYGATVDHDEMVQKFGIRAPDDLSFEQLQSIQEEAIKFVKENNYAIDGYWTYMWALWPLENDFRDRDKINDIREFTPTQDYIHTMREILQKRAFKKATSEVNSRIRNFANQFTSKMEGYTLNEELKDIAQRWQTVKATWSRNENKFIYTYPE